MKKASRLMPKYEPRKANKIALFAFIAITLAVVIYQPWYLAIVAGITVLVVIWNAIYQTKVEKYFIELCKNREGLSICEFAREFDAKLVDTWVVRAVYEQVQAALPTKQSVPIKASDTLFEVLMLDEDDLDLDLVEEIS